MGACGELILAARHNPLAYAHADGVLLISWPCGLPTRRFCYVHGHYVCSVHQASRHARCGKPMDGRHR
jgi:hypothetical protein